MDFYDGSSAKTYSRNKTRIIKEINAIEETIADSVDNNLFECDVNDTVMTDLREFAEPNKTAEAHCIMELDTVRIHKDGSVDSDNFLNEIDGDHAEQDGNVDEVMCGHAPDFDPDNYANGGYADEQLIQSGHFRVGELLVASGRNDVNPLEFKVSEVNSDGEIVDLEIISRGEFTDEIFSSANLVYKDLDRWLDLYSDYGLKADLRIDRDGNVRVKDLTDIKCDEILLTSWQPIVKTYMLGTLPPAYFGNIGDIYIENGDMIYVKTYDKWEMRNKIHTYQTFRLPNDYGFDGLACYNVFGQNWVKTKGGWQLAKAVYNLGNAYRPSPFDYNEGDIIHYNEVIRNDSGEIIETIPYTLYKCCSKGWKEIVEECDWQNVPADDFGIDLDLFVYPDDSYKVRINGKWIMVDNEYRFDSMYLNDDFGKEHDVIVYKGDYEAFSTYVKLKASDDYPQGHWTRVEKVWNLNDYLLGKLPVAVDLTWTVKNIVLDKKGDGYIYTPNVIFSEGNAQASAKIINDKISEIVLDNGGSDYLDTIPEINFVMISPTLSKKYYQVWKQTLSNTVLQDEMEQVISYFEDTKGYTISRVSNSDGKTFHWHLIWS